jgi:hypothetical protein
MEPAKRPRFRATTVGGGPFEFGPDDPRLQLVCAQCNRILATVPLTYEFRGAWGEIVYVCPQCGEHNVGPRKPCGRRGPPSPDGQPIVCELESGHTDRHVLTRNSTRLSWADGDREITFTS